ncbi:hypothetical protein C0Q70_00407 [Pomacea canaliculata]|uniref:Uncharacterized protein n=1 Tax=Pomacea canaliculata TaxID=400727 RepID=A0A2T7PWJ2_POMCA|nr:hypothetical protein C0Q70_00407 [Pomacea canaliculata]
MTTIRSSVRPRSSKQPWGTILKPEFGLGYQKMTEYEIEQTVQRLYTVPTNKKPTYIRHNKHMKREDIDAMVSNTSYYGINAFLPLCNDLPSLHEFNP